MFGKIYNFWQILRGTLWFTPALFCFFAFTAVTLTYWIEDSYLPGKFELPSILYNGSIEEARDLIVVLMSSLITMTTLVISITVVVLTLASSQLGPRLIKSFMSDPTTQKYIGLFFGAIVSCFVVLRILLDGNLIHDAPPRLSISFVIFYAFSSLFVLLFFVHHVAESCIADSAIQRVSQDLMNTIKRLCENKKQPETKGSGKSEGFPKDFDSKKKSLTFDVSGYIQTIDYRALLDIACEKDLYIDLGSKAGRYIVAGQNGVYAYPEDRLNEEIEKCIFSSVVLGAQRTPTQDPEYSIRHLIEIALRALSPGINDPFTAATVIDRLSTALVCFFESENPTYNFYDEKGRLRVRGIPLDGEAMIDSAYNQIRQAAKNKPDVTIHLLRSIVNIAPLARTKKQKETLKKQAAMIKEQTEKDALNDSDYQDIIDEYNEALKQL